MMSSILEQLSWAPQVLYVSAALPQVYMNMKARGAHGVSSLMVFTRFTTCVWYLTYVFWCKLPLSYHVMFSLYTASFSLLALQVYWYAFASEKRLLRVGYALGFAVLVAFGVYGYMTTFHAAGLLLGSAAVSVGFFNDVPQVIKNWKRQSIEGFSFSFATALGIGASFELVIALMMGLPVPTIVSPARAALFYLIFLYQFFRYKK